MSTQNQPSGSSTKVKTKETTASSKLVTQRGSRVNLSNYTENRKYGALQTMWCLFEPQRVVKNGSSVSSLEGKSDCETAQTRRIKQLDLMRVDRNPADRPAAGSLIIQAMNQLWLLQTARWTNRLKYGTNLKWVLIPTWCRPGCFVRSLVVDVSLSPTSTCACVEYFGRALETLVKKVTVHCIHGKMKNKRNKIFADFRALKKSVCTKPQQWINKRFVCISYESCVHPLCCSGGVSVSVDTGAVASCFPTFLS